MEDIKEQLFSIFESFCSFGDRGATAAIDGAKFAKLCRDCGVLDRHVTTTQVDIVFAKVKARGARKITFREFVQALALIAEERFPGDEDGFGRLVDLILTTYKGPVAVGTSPETKGIFAKLTDHSLYTGSHSLRFDESGKGLGLAGRDAVAVGQGSLPIYHDGDPVKDLSQIMRTSMRGGTHISSVTAARREGQLPKLSSSLHAAPALQAAPTPQRGSAAPGTPSRYHGAFASGEAPSPSSAFLRTRHLGVGGGSQEGGGEARPTSAAAAMMSPATTAEAARRVIVPRTPADEEGISDLRAVFLAYCAYGATTSVPTELDSARFAKLCRGAGLVAGSPPADPPVPQLPPASVDVAFAKAKARGRRLLSYDQFLFALQLLGLEVFPGEEPLAAAQRIIALVVDGGGPSSNSSSAAGSSRQQSGVFSKLTDTSRYTGAHRHRFDAEGRGLGMEGRDDVPTGATASRARGPAVRDLSQILRPGI